jgi:hypothetical protein
MADEKKGFGAKLKGVGKAIGRGLKKVPGIAYRDVVKPYAQHMADKFTEPTTLSERVGPIEDLPIGMGRKADPRREGPSQPRVSLIAGPIHRLPIGRKAAAKRKRTPGRGKTAAYDMPGKSAVERLNETAPKKKVMSPAPKKEPKKEPRTQSEGRVTKSTDLTAGKQTGEVVTVIGEMPPTRRTKPKARKRKFSPKRTRETLNKAGEARREQMAAVPPPDTTAQEMARMMTEQDVSREAERAQAALKGGRKPQREKARYRYQTRGYKRSEGRSR